MCLCGVLAAESAGLPAAVVEEARTFFNRTAFWLKTGLKHSALDLDFSDADLEKQSFAILAQLEGAMLIARVQGQPGWFDDLTSKLSANLTK